MKSVSNWGRYPKINARVLEPGTRNELVDSSSMISGGIARGLGRCYGDSSLSETIISSTRLNRFLSFDREHGILNCEAGVTFDEILTVIVPEGWFLPVTPGTRYITVGGAIASDVHGKNHHVAGSFSDYVRAMELLLATGEVITLSPQSHPELFEATRGGMGLTGIILSAEFSLKKISTAFIRQKTIKLNNLDDAMAAFDEYAAWPYSVAWIDCLATGKNLGRSLLMVGDNAESAELSIELQSKALSILPGVQLNVPFSFPGFVLNGFSVRAFNSLYYGKAPSGISDSMVHYQPFYYPLDAIHNWNRIYGPGGFTQYQFVLPPETARNGLVAILEAIAKKGMGSFLAVLKQFGHQDNWISFPMRGYTLALDFPIRPGLFEFLTELDHLVLKYGGRLYLTKDVRMNRQMMEAGYPKLEKWLSVIRQVNPDLKWSSLQFRRLFGDLHG